MSYPSTRHVYVQIRISTHNLTSREIEKTIPSTLPLGIESKCPTTLTYQYKNMIGPELSKEMSEKKSQKSLPKH